MSELARLLVERGHLTRDRLEEIEHRVKWLDETLDRVILGEGLIPEEVLLGAISEITGIPSVRIGHERIDDAAVELVPGRVAAHYQIMPLRLEGALLTIATNRTYEVAEEDQLRVVLNSPIKWVLCKSHEISESIKHYYGVGLGTFLGIEERSAGLEAGRKGAGEDNKDISDFVVQIVRDAIQSNATDIHFEPYEDRLKLRYRVDGVLTPIPLPRGAGKYQKAIVSSIKVMAQLKISDRRLPQDGRFAVSVDAEQFDVRVSVLPTRHGEGVNLRLLNARSTFLNMQQLGLREEQMAEFESLISLSYGVVLFTGATGSGKTTSLYATLSRLNDDDRKIITIEDPVEYQIEGIMQMQVHPEIGFTFASGLRHTLRHDPDVILIGEIRDDETAKIATSAALTGHLVLSTLHTNDSGSAVARLIDMVLSRILSHRVCRA